eukprot:720434_1
MQQPLLSNLDGSAGWESIMAATPQGVQDDRKSNRIVATISEESEEANQAMPMLYRRTDSDSPALALNQHSMHLSESSAEAKFAEPASLSLHAGSKLSFNGFHQWTIKGSLLNDVLSSKVGKTFRSDQFKMANIGNSVWQIEIHPNGWDHTCKGYCTVYLSLLTMPSSWNKIIICRTIQCPQTGSSLTKIASYTRRESRGWMYALPYDELQNGDLSTLDLMITIQTLQIQLKRSQELYYEFDFVYQKKRQFMYKVDEAMMNRLTQCNPGKRVESEIFDRLWCVGLCPNGNTPQNAGKCVVSLSLCALPRNVCRMKVRWTMSIKKVNQKASKTNDFSFDSECKTVNWSAISFSKFKKVKQELTVWLEIEILSEYDKYGDEIKTDDEEENVVSYTAPSETHQQVMALQGNIETMSHKIEELTETLSQSFALHTQKDEEIKELSKQIERISKENAHEMHDMTEQVNAIEKQFLQMNGTLRRIADGHDHESGSCVCLVQ